MHWISKRALPLAQLDDHDLQLQVALRCWQDAADGSGLIPPRCSIDTPGFRLLLPTVDWIDLTTTAEPLWPLGRLQAFAEADPESPGGNALGPRRLGNMLRVDLRTLRFTGSPVAQELVLRPEQDVEAWRFLMLPTSDDGVRVREVLLVLERRLVLEAALV